MTTSSAECSSSSIPRAGRRVLWVAPWLAVVVMVLSGLDELRAAVQRSGSAAAHELPEVAVTSAVITSIVAYWVALAAAQACALMLDRWFDDRGWVPLGSRMCIAVLSATALLVLAAHAFANLGPGAGDVPIWVRMLLGAAIAILAGFHVSRRSSDRREIGPALTALGIVGLTALSF